jgi:hypothetical protein
MGSLEAASNNHTISNGSRLLLPRERQSNTLKMGKITRFQVEDGL